jgi:hypothetical protein
MRECTGYINDDYDDENHRPCSCPVCGGFLKWEEKDGELQPICNKCEYPLIAYPIVEDGEVSEYEGKICPIGKFKGNWDYCI